VNCGLRGADNRKPRADAKLKNLPTAKQAAIAEYAGTHTLSQTVEWLRSENLETSNCALSIFLSWYLMPQRLAENSAKEIITRLVRLNSPAAQSVFSGKDSEEVKVGKLMEMLFPKENASP
jgi:hypothetical protein